jgi:apolipoprotein D and lipocalin family protein
MNAPTRALFLSRFRLVCWLHAAVLLAAMGQPAAAQSLPPLQVVAPVDLKRYAGVWYEQARLPNRFQEKCAGQVSARYSLRADGRIDVLNRCVRSPGDVEEALGEARAIPVPGLTDAGRLEVRFAPAWMSWLPFVWGDYWILALDPGYEVALVGTPNREYLWVLSREQRVSPARLEAMLEHARSAGFPVDRVIRTPAEPALPRD